MVIGGLHTGPNPSKYMHMNQTFYSDTYIIEGADLILPDRILPKAMLAVLGGRIAHIFRKNEFQSPADAVKIDPALEGAPVIHAPNAYVAPALIEMHIHGCGDWGFERLSSSDVLKVTARFLEEKGVSCFVPTLLWEETSFSALVAAIEACGLPRSVIPGLYLEGPFVNPAKRGGIQPENIAAPDVALAERILDLSHGLLRICAIAPELDGVEALYPVFQNAGVLVSMGHSAASLQSARLPPHPYSMTHLFNAMSGIDHKAGGLANLVFSGEPDYVELNGDGIHVNETCLRLAACAVPEESLALISDAVVGSGRPYGSFRYYGHEVISSERGVRYADTDVLMGSNRLGIEIVRNFVSQTGVPLWRAVRAMSLVPRTALGMDREYGSIEVGKVADVFLWDRDIEVAVRPAALMNSGATFPHDTRI